MAPRADGYANGNGLHRTLPHSIEAEESVLASILIDAAETIPRCVDARLTDDSFYDPKNGIIYAACLRMHAAGVPIEPATLAEWMRSAKQLEIVGSYAFITQVSSRVGTTAQAHYFIQKVRDFATLRDIIRTSTQTVEEAYGVTADVDAFVEVFQRRARAISDSGSFGSAEALMERAFNPAHLISRPDAIYSVNGTPICTPGNLTAIYSQAKTGKSSFLAAMIAAAMSTPSSGHDTLGVTGPNYSNGAVLHFDTEQAPYDWQQLVQSALRRAGLALPPAWLMTFTIAGMEALKAEKFIQTAVRFARKTHHRIHSIFIDGVADLVNDPNSPDECFPLVARLHGMAIEYNTAIVNILHLNPAGKDKVDKGRGHLGSQLERKCESNLTLKKTGDVTTVVGEGRQRGRPIPADKSPSFSWSDEHAMHRTCATPEAGQKGTPGGRPEKYSFDDFKSVFPLKSGPGVELAQLHRLLITNRDVRKDSLHSLMRRWQKDGLVEIIQQQGQAARYRAAV